MKITAQEEYGLRILIRIAGCKNNQGMSIPQLSEAEQLSTHYVAKLTRALRMSNLIYSTPGNKGGYTLSLPADQIVIKHVLEALGTPIIDQQVNTPPPAIMRFCTNSVDCSSRSLWQILQLTIDRILSQITLQDLIDKEEVSAVKFSRILREKPVLEL